jgi:hypothetical protein
VGSTELILELVDHRPDVVESWWTPFTSSDGYEHPHWWQSAGGTIGDPWFVQVLEAGVEVARVQLDEIGGINPDYLNVPAIGDEQLEIQFIEVATAVRRRKIGPQAVQALSVRNPDRRLLAYSEGADEFWASLGWDRFDHSEGRHRALFIQPER